MKGLCCLRRDFSINFIKKTSEKNYDVSKLPALLTLCHIYVVFRTVLVLGIFGHFLSLLELRNNFIKVCTKPWMKKLNFWRLDLLVSAAQQSRTAKLPTLFQNF